MDKSRYIFIRLTFYFCINFFFIHLLITYTNSIINNFKSNINNVHELWGLINKLPINMFSIYFMALIEIALIASFEIILKKKMNKNVK